MKKASFFNPLRLAQKEGFAPVCFRLWFNFKPYHANLSRRGGQTQTQLPLLSRPFESLQTFYNLILLSCDKSPMERKRNAISFGRINEKNKRKSDAFRIYFENEQKHSFFRYHAGAWRFIEPPAPRLRPFESHLIKTNKKSEFFQPTSFGAERGIRTLGAISRTQPFQGCTLNHSDISAFTHKYSVN